jgi:BNR repeat-like domain
MRRVGLLALAIAAFASGTAVAAPPAAAPSFASEQLVGTLSDDFWEPTTAADPHTAYVYQAVTGIGAHECAQHNCPGTSILVRASSDGGTTWSPLVFVCGIACKNVGWQFDPQLAVAADGTLYAAWLNTFNPGTVLSKSYDHGRTWTAPVTMNGNLTYNDKPTLVISPSGKDVYITFDDKADAYVVVSHDYGASFGAPIKTNSDAYTYLGYGGAVAPNGNVYFAQTGEPKSGSGNEPVSLVTSRDGGQTWTRTTLDTSSDPPVCTFKGCYADFYSSQATVAADASGRLVFAYLKNSAPFAPKSLYVRTSTDGTTWSTPALVNSLGDSNMPSIAAGPTAGDFRLVWQDNRNAADSWNTWYATSKNGGSTWSAPVRLSNLTTGAPYKSRAGYTFPFGDYGGLTVDSAGTSFVIWGEGDGIYTGGGTGGSWWTRGR